MICKSSNIFYRFGNDRILPKICSWNGSLQKLKTVNYARYTALKNHFLWFMEYENVKIKLWSTISILKPWHVEIFHYKKINYVQLRKVQLRFVNSCNFVVTEGYHILLSPLNRLFPWYFIMFRMYIIRTSWEHNQRKRKCSERWRSWGLWAPKQRI